MRSPIHQSFLPAAARLTCQARLTGRLNGKERPIKIVVMAGEREGFLGRLAEKSKRLDMVLIGLGAGIFVLFSPPVGAVIVIGSALTIIPAEMVKRASKKKK